MKDIIRYLASLPRRQKQLVFVAMDVCVLPLIMWLVYAIRLAKPNVPVMQGLDFWYLYVGMFGVLIFALLGIYSAIVRSFNEDYLLRISIATFIQIVGLYAIKKLDLAFIPMSIPLMYGFMLFSWMWWSRAVIRYATLKTFAKKQNRKRVAIYGAGSLQYVLEHGQQDDWFNDGTIVTLSVISFFSLFFFIWRQLTYDFPIVNLKVLKDTNLRVGTILSFIMGFGLYGSTFIIPIYTQSILGWTATDAGLLLIPSSLMTAFMMPIIGQLLQRGVPQKYLVAIGFLMFFFFTFWMYNIMTPDTGEEFMYWPLIIRGLGLGLLFVPITTLSLSTLKGKSIGEGAAFTGMMRQLGGSFGIAIITTFIARFSQEHRVNLIGNIDATKVQVQDRISQLQHGFMAKGFSSNEALDKAHKIIDLSITKQSTVLAYMDIFLFLGILFLICIPIILLIKNNKNKVNISEAMH